MAPTILALLASLSWGELRVVKLEMDAPGARDPKRLEKVFGVRPGELLDREALRMGVQALLATQEVEDAWVELDKVPEGAVVRVHAQVASRVADLKFVGLPRKQRALVAKELKLEVGTPLVGPRFEQALARAAQLLRADGFPEATLEPQLDFHVEAGVVDVTIRARLGSQRVLCDLRADGLPPGLVSLWRATGAKKGQRLTKGALEGFRRRLTTSLRRMGFWEVEVEGPELSPIACGTQAFFLVKPGPQYSLRVEGEKVSRKTLANVFPFLSGEDSFAPGSEGWLAERLKRELQRDGFPFARVEVELRTDLPEPVLAIKVQRGRKLPVKAVRFPGVPAGSPLIKKLEEHILVGERGLSALTGSRWDDDTLAADRDSLLATLKGMGYAQAEVDSPQLVEEGKGVAVEFPIRLGPRWSVEEVELRGWPEALQVPELPVKVGEAWNPSLVEQARTALLAQLRAVGFASASVTVDHRCQEHRCRPLFLVTTGPQFTVGRVVVGALVRTKPEVVDALVRVKEGDPLSPEALVLAQRRLLELGIFDRVAIREIPGQELGLRRGLVIDAEEAPTRSLAGGIGWDTEEKLRVSGSWTELNLFGRARTISVEGRFSSRQRRFQLNYREPAGLGIFGFPTWVAVYRTEESFPTYSLLRRGMWVELGNHLQRPGRLLLRYDYQIIAPDAPEAVLSQLERNRQHLRLASLTPIFEWDTRDDLFSPRTGAFVSLQLQRAFPVFLADASFSKFLGSASFYTSAGKTVVALGVKTGFIKPYQGDGELPDNLRVPVAVRFFAGGRITHRSFATDQLGVPGQTLLCPEAQTTCPVSQLRPVGGGALVLGSMEWRIPVAGSLGITLFTDGGNTWAGVSNVKLAEMRWGAGLGLRFETPVGPIRLEYGWKLDRQPGESKGELFLSFGNPF
ncbi:MAG: BamA/TamA family outer membrane protein [Thermoanaerobaculaceae bacterium]